MESQSGWHYLTKDNSSYMMKKTNDGNRFKIMVTDMIHVWVKESCANELLHIFQELNPLIECSDHSIVHKIWAMLDEEESMSSSSISLNVALMDDMTLNVKFKTEMDGLRVKFHLQLVKETPHLFYEEVTVPLVSAAQELVSRQESLCIQLVKKDAEIAQYKLEGASLSRRNVETQVFSKLEFLSKSHMQGGTTSPCEGVLKVLQGASFLPNSNIVCEAKTLRDTGRPVCSHLQDDKSSISNKVNDLEQSKLDTNFVMGDGAEKFQAIEPSVRGSQIKMSRKKKIKLNL